MKQNYKLSLKSYSLALCVGLIASSTTTLTFAKSPADPNKVLRYVFPVAETGFDPAGVHDLYSAHVNGSIFETLYTYDYLASPAKLVPRTAVALPEISADGLTYTIRLQKGIYFANDPAFKGKNVNSHLLTMRIPLNDSWIRIYIHRTVGYWMDVLLEWMRYRSKRKRMANSITTNRLWDYKRQTDTHWLSV